MIGETLKSTYSKRDDAFDVGTVWVLGNVFDNRSGLRFLHCWWPCRRTLKGTEPVHSELLYEQSGNLSPVHLGHES